MKQYKNISNFACVFIRVIQTFYVEYTQFFLSLSFIFQKTQDYLGGIIRIKRVFFLSVLIGLFLLFGGFGRIFVYADDKMEAGNTEATSSPGETPKGDSEKDSEKDSGGNLLSPGFKMNSSTLIPDSPNTAKGGEGFIDLMGKFARMALVALAFLSALFIVIGGIYIASSAGNSERVTKGRTIIIYNMAALSISVTAILLVGAIQWFIHI